jgi:hypothetical protein
MVRAKTEKQKGEIPGRGERNKKCKCIIWVRKNRIETIGGGKR